MSNTQPIEERITVLEMKVAKLESERTNNRAVDKNIVLKKKQSPKEFILKFGKLTQTEKTLVLAYYLEHVDANDAFNVADLENVFRVAKESVPVNMNDMVNKNVIKGFLMPDRAKKAGKMAWVLTSTGERIIEDKLESTDE